MTTLDPRTKEDIMALLAERAREYAPMWRYGGNAQDDPGAAIFELFGELFFQTIDRFNGIPAKLYTEFLNLLAVPSPCALPSSSYMRFRVGAAAMQNRACAASGYPLLGAKRGAHALRRERRMAVLERRSLCSVRFRRRTRRDGRFGKTIP